MAAQAEPSVFVDLTMDDESLSELSDAAGPTSSSSSPKPKSKSGSNSNLASRPVAKSASTGVKKSASSSNIASTKSQSKSKSASTSNGTAKPKARKSDPSPSSRTNAQAESANATGKRRQDGTQDTSAPSRSVPISDVVRARTHVNYEGGPQKLCHQHHQNCKGALLECTFMRAPGKRCQGRYCFSTLKRLYDQDPETIVKSNRMMINPAEHCPPTETKYAWKCPRCRGKCACSVCRKAAGLEPLGRPFGASKQGKSAPLDSSAAGASESKPKKTKSKAGTNGAGSKAAAAASSAKTSAKATAKVTSKGRNIAEAVAAAQKHNGKGKATPSTTAGDDGSEDDGIHTPPPPDSSSKLAPKKTLASLLSTTTTATGKAPAFKQLKPPAEAAPPVFEVIPTKLPEENMRARMWIYESMVRFDKFGLNRGVLSQLDRLEHWTHAMAQDMLACLLKTMAGMTNIDKGQPTKPFVKAVTAFRTHGKSLQRGEPWSAAAELISIFGLAHTPLAFVEHDIPVEVEAAAAQRSPSPPAARVTRARRAKESNQYEMVRQLSLLDQWEEDEFGGGDEDDDEDALPSKRRRVPTKKKSIYVYDDPSDDDESMADPDDSSARGRRLGRARKAADNQPAPEIRLTGRQQAIKLQQEQQKEEQAAAEKQRQEEEDDDEARQAQASRKRRRSTNGTASDGSDDEGIHHNGLDLMKKSRLRAGSSADEAESDDGADAESRDKEHRDVQFNGATNVQAAEQAEQEVDSPDLETKVSILSALIDAAVMAESITEELKTAPEQMTAMERTHKAANHEMEREIAEELAELNKRAPSIVSPEYQKWKAEKASLEHDHAWRRQDARVTSELALDTHALRTGPIGHDVDGREYWHLREYQERMPKYTEGRYAWCLVVMGPAFPQDPNKVQEGANEEENVKQEEGDTNGKQDDADDSGLTSLDASTDNGEAAAESEAMDVKLGLPTSLQNGGSKTEADNSTATATTRICMGANDPATIKKLIDYVRFRLERVEYEESVAMQEREKAARLAKEGGGGGDGSRASSPVDADSETAASAGRESVYSVRKAKQTLKDTQEERRKQVEQLLKRLTKSKEYFAWHREEVAP
ncbi:hypothetical protein EX895_004515 [Sporisorium graminicola]|uniref:Zinc-finger domain-containing protein n=1 Tax=Sporisorium graminicola TaxID=280036 RepID=A0A4U7KQU7_9BASI|nr:hypothetical protein EX895_004515 [Sporisorium graminicola]TKY86366.1 hypothetical protein EX895_004515 [Sporisorium graminicola]